MYNKGIPEERVALNVIQNYDKIAEENSTLRTIVRELREETETLKKKVKELQAKADMELSESVMQIYKRGFKAAKNEVIQFVSGIKPKYDKTDDEECISD